MNKTKPILFSTPYISGNDFAETTDLCASTILFKKPDDKKTYFYTHYWIPESKLEMSPDDVFSYFTREEAEKALEGLETRKQRGY